MKWLGNFKFSSHDTDYQEVVKASSVVEYMQEGARLQLEECGPTEKDMKANNFAFVLSRYFNLELEAGLGYICTGYDEFECDGCGRKVAEGIHHYVGPTKLAVNLVYVF